MEKRDRVQVVVVELAGQFLRIDFRETCERFLDAVLQEQEGPQREVIGGIERGLPGELVEEGMIVLARRLMGEALIRR